MRKVAFKSLNDLYTKGAGYAGIMMTRPQTLGYGLSDSPAGLAAFFYDKFNDWTYSGGDAVTSQRGSSQSSSLPRCARRSDHFANADIPKGPCHD
jgi:hypothetical protein